MTDTSDFEPSTIPDPTGASSEDDLPLDARGTDARGLGEIAAQRPAHYRGEVPPNAAAALRSAAARRSRSVAQGVAGRPSAPVSEPPSTRSLPPALLGAQPRSTEVESAPPAASLPEDSSRTMMSSKGPPERSAHTTIKSVARPGPPPSQSWDERRIVHLEREVDQLVARLKLGEKRLRSADVQQRWLLFGLAALVALEVLHWLL